MPMVQNIALATVQVDNLEVRAEPGLSAPILNDANAVFDAGGMVRLKTGDHVMIISGAIATDGLWWVKIGADGRLAPGERTQAVVGWAEAGTAADPIIEADNSWCPGEGRSLTTLLGLSGIERFGCYSSIPIVIQAYRAKLEADGMGGACEAPPGQPAWLVCENINHNWVNRDGGTAWEFLLHFNPATGIPATGLVEGTAPNPLLHITGHFDDEAATMCAPNPPVTLADSEAWLDCSSLFVVDQLN